jgi:ferritin-like metal-binding protein YciE
MAKQVGGLRQLLLEELQDLFDAEKQLVRALPKMAKSATDPELESALLDHLDVTRSQVQRLEQVFQSMDMRACSRPCRGMQGIVEEGKEVMGQERDDAALDSAIAASGRKVEHYEMMGYENACSIARQLGMRDAAQLLHQTLREEMQADRQLAQISKRLLSATGKPAGRAARSSRSRSPQSRKYGRTASRAPRRSTGGQSAR